MALDENDLECILAAVQEHDKELLVSMSASFRRIEECVAAVDSFLFERLSEIEEKIDTSRHDLSDAIAKVRGDTRELLADEE